MRISDIADKSGLSIDTIRYYEKSGLCPAIARGPDGNRIFSGKDAAWFELLASLRETGMPTNDMRTFAGLYVQGDKTVSDRKQMLQVHRNRLHERQAALDRCQNLLAYKLARYDAILGGSS